MGAVEEGTLLYDSRGGIEEERQLYAVRLRRSHGSVVALFVELPYLIFLGK